MEYTDDFFETGYLTLHHYAAGKHISQRDIWSKEELFRLCDDTAALSGAVWYEETTPRELLLNLFDCTPETATEEDKEDAAWIFCLANKHGWDAALYRADYTLSSGEYTTRPVSIIQAACDFLTHDVDRIECNQRS